jgi:hypothetical protein
MLFFAGILLAVDTVLIVLWLRRRMIVVTYYEWVVIALGIVLLMIALQNYFASSNGYEPVAPGKFLLIFALPGVLLFALAAGLVSRRQFRRRDIIKRTRTGNDA